MALHSCNYYTGDPMSVIATDVNEDDTNILLS